MDKYDVFAAVFAVAFVITAYVAAAAIDGGKCACGALFMLGRKTVFRGKTAHMHDVCTTTNKR